MAKNGRRAWTQHAASRIGSRMAPSQIELVIAVIGVGLQDAGIPCQTRLGMRPSANCDALSRLDLSL